MDRTSRSSHGSRSGPRQGRGSRFKYPDLQKGAIKFIISTEDEDGEFVPEYEAEEGVVIFSLKIQFPLTDSQVGDDGPTDETLEAIDRELRTYLEAEFEVKSLELLEDSPASHAAGSPDKSTDVQKSKDGTEGPTG